MKCPECDEDENFCQCERERLNDKLNRVIELLEHILKELKK